MIEVKLNGIYERRDGVIVRCICIEVNYGYTDAGQGVLIRDGTYYQDGNDSPFDLIREIVVGEGWLPWNGGECPGDANTKVEVVLRNGDDFQVKADRVIFKRGDAGPSNPDYEIIAYRVIIEEKSADDNADNAIRHIDETISTIADIHAGLDTTATPLDLFPMRAPTGYAPLAAVLFDALNQASSGKGKERHARGDTPFDRQPICEIGRMLGIGGPLFQVMKKSQEANTMHNRGDHEAAIRELLGAINYAAAAIIIIKENMK